MKTEQELNLLARQVPELFEGGEGVVEGNEVCVLGVAGAWFEGVAASLRRCGWPVRIGYPLELAE